MRKSLFSKKSKSASALLKDDIQGILRALVIKRDGGCWLRHYPQAGRCGSRKTKDGHLILQGEHLHTRSNLASFADSRLVVCICENHHIHWKTKHSEEYNALARDFIGEERSKLWDSVVESRFIPKKIDMKLEFLALKQEYERMV